MSPNSVVDTKFFLIFSLCFCPFQFVKVRLSRICLHSCAVTVTGLLSSLLMSFVVLKFDGLLIWGLCRQILFSREAVKREERRSCLFKRGLKGVGD